MTDSDSPNTPRWPAVTVPDPLTPLQEKFPDYLIWREITGERVRYVARSRRTNLNPHTIVTSDVAELWAALEHPRNPGLPPFVTTTPSVAGVYDVLLGGKDNFAADRDAAKKILDHFPEAIPIARAGRAFQARAVRHAARQGITQYIDLGAGLPTSPNTHGAAREIVPGARVAYVDSAELVVAHARAMLADDDRVAVIAGDLRDPAAILSDPALTGLIDLAQPVCVLLISVLHFLPPDEADAAVAALRERMPSGSYLVISAGTSTGTDPDVIASLQDAYSALCPVTGRTEAEIAAWFDRLTFARPGLVDVWDWRPDSLPRLSTAPTTRARYLAGVARKLPVPPWQP